MNDEKYTVVDGMVIDRETKVIVGYVGPLASRVLHELFDGCTE